MKNRKVLLTVLSIGIMLILNSTKSYALMPRVVYNEVNVIISSIMRIAIPVFVIAYIVFAIIYFIKSKEDKKNKIKTLIILLVVNIIMVIALHYCADIVLEAGATYSSKPINWLK